MIHINDKYPTLASAKKIIFTSDCMMWQKLSKYFNNYILYLLQLLMY